MTCEHKEAEDKEIEKEVWKLISDDNVDDDNTGAYRVDKLIVVFRYRRRAFQLVFFL